MQCLCDNAISSRYLHYFVKNNAININENVKIKYLKLFKNSHGFI